MLSLAEKERKALEKKIDELEKELKAKEKVIAELREEVENWKKDAIWGGLMDNVWRTNVG